MEDVLLTDAPERDRAEIESYIESHGGAIVLRVGDKIGSDAKQEMLAYRKQHGELPPHDFVWIGHATLGRDSSAADVDGAGSETRSGHHESVGERQGRQPALLVRLWRRFRGQSEPAREPDRWLDDDDPIARIVNEAWQKGSSSWTEGEPLPPKVQNPRKVERGD
jgi:hypothetical protein